MPHIVVLATGGTISSRASAAGSVATDGGSTLVGAVALPAVTVESVDVARANSFNLTMGDLRGLALAIAEQLARPEVDGIVVTHGTDTLEESAFLADAVHDDERPVVFTGAQRGADHPAADGPDNLRDAVALAADPLARGRGVLVCFAGAVFAARGVYKADTLAPAPFAARGGGPIGRVCADGVAITATPARPEPLGMPGPGFAETRVDAVLCYPGSGSVGFDAALLAGARGIVLTGTGAGNPGAELIPAIAAATEEGIPVVLATRVPEGPVVPLYGGGGGVDAVRAGAVPAGALPASQARILLALLLDLGPAHTAGSRFARHARAAASPLAPHPTKEGTQ